VSGFLQALIQSSLWCDFCSSWAKAFQHSSWNGTTFTAGNLKTKVETQAVIRETKAAGDSVHSTQFM